MKHDELLRKMAKMPIDLKGTVIMYEALVAVVELHCAIDNEIERIYPDTYFEELICSQCRTIAYPCPTIQAVEKEFN